MKNKMGVILHPAQTWVRIRSISYPYLIHKRFLTPPSPPPMYHPPSPPHIVWHAPCLTSIPSMIYAAHAAGQMSLYIMFHKEKWHNVRNALMLSGLRYDTNKKKIPCELMIMRQTFVERCPGRASGIPGRIRRKAPPARRMTRSVPWNHPVPSSLSLI